jgi:DNA polymerase-3 subunit epsilon
MAPNVLDGERVLAFDLETTGISTSSDRIVQIALIGAAPDGTAIHFEQIINPRRPIPYGASNVHGIFDQDVRGKGDFSTIADKVAEMIEGSVIVGHNVRRFDLQLLEAEFFRLGKRMPRPKAVMDTIELVRRLNIPRPHNLGALCVRHGISLENAHTAAADAAASLLLFWRLSIDHAPSFRHSLEELERWAVHGSIASDATKLGRGLGDLELVDQLGKIRKDGEQIILAFGRHKGRDVKEIHFEDPRYIHWLLSAKGVGDDDARDVIRAYLGIDE